MEPAVIWTDPHDVQARLAELDLTQEDLVDALLIGDLGGRSCSTFEPPNAAGTTMYSKATGALRGHCYRNGWSLDNGHNLARVVHPSGAFAIAVSSGNGDTANPNNDPTTRYGKGPASERIVEANYQLSLFSVADIPLSDEEITPDGRTTWYLLHHTTQQHIRAELSLPCACDDTGAFVKWTERIILGKIDRGNQPKVKAERPPEPNIDVDVERRAEG